MDFLKNAAQTLNSASGDKQEAQTNTDVMGLANQAAELLNNASTKKEGESNVATDLLGKLNSALGGGAEAEKKEDMLDKAVDLFQEHALKAGPQSNENAAEQAKDEMIANAIRTGYKSLSGKEFPDYK